jgi:hypothetical protein
MAVPLTLSVYESILLSVYTRINERDIDMRIPFSVKCSACLLCFYLFTIPLFAQDSDTTTLMQNEPANSTQQTLYPPSQQVPPPPSQINHTQTGSQDDFFAGRTDGERDGMMVKTGSWFFMGCCLGVTGVLVAYIIDPTVPSSANMMGKSSAYIMGYNEGYEKAVKKLRSKKALNGCIVSGVCAALYYVLGFVLFAASAA